MTDGNAGGNPAPDAIELLSSHHREVERIWTQLEAADRGSDVARQLTTDIVKLLSQHDAVETQLLYPAVREVPGGDELADHSLEEHQRVRELLKEVDRGDVGDEGTFGRLVEAIQSVMGHVQEEEGVLFPRMRETLDADQLVALGTKMAEAMATAPTHPHPTTPNNPVGAAVAGAVTGVVDRARDAMRGGS
jgi:hemerythrin superfamily protein